MITLRIAGAFTKSHIIIPTVLKHKNSNLEFQVYDGIDNLPWNGGRVNSVTCGKFDKKIYDVYQKLGIGVFLTFSNFEIDLTNAKGLSYLELLNSGKNNGIILVNDDLRKLCREKFKNLKLIYSITGHSNDYTQFDASLENLYDLIVPRFENVFGEICKKSPQKYEIMLNDTCRVGCNFWNDHFKAVSFFNTIQHTPEVGKAVNECWIPNFDFTKRNTSCKGMDLDENALQEAYEIGFRHFKFSGRENPDTEFENELIEYIEKLRSLK